MATDILFANNNYCKDDLVSPLCPIHCSLLSNLITILYLFDLTKVMLTVSVVGEVGEGRQQIN